MKRLWGLLFVAALLFGLAVPAAAAVSLGDASGYYEAAIAKYEPPAGYPYYMVFHEKRFDGYTQVNFIASKTPVVQAGDSVVYTSYGSWNGAFSNPRLWENTSFEVRLSGSQYVLFVLGDISGMSTGFGCGVFMKDVSTADFYNRKDILAGHSNLTGYYYENLDLSELEELLAQAEAIENDDYTSVSWSVLVSAIYRGKAVLDKTNPKQAEVDIAVNDLRSAINGLVKNNVPAPPDGPDNHRYLVDGFRPEDLLPAENAIMENFREGRKFGLYVFGAVLMIWILVRIMKKVVHGGFSGDTRRYEKR